ncbi:MAG: hypothetical protein M3Y33_06340 [Actinomycetota bacterium]|nr:hypothetical protein [Actinomycetota bacterium]
MGGTSQAELAWQQKGTRAWEAASRGWFEPVRLDSAQVRELRRLSSRSDRPRRSRQDPALRVVYIGRLARLIGEDERSHLAAAAGPFLRDSSSYEDSWLDDATIFGDRPALPAA